MSIFPSDSPPETFPARRYLPWYRRCLPSWRTVAIAMLLLLATPFAIRGYCLWRIPDVPVPFDVEAFCELPSIEDNAYTDFARAANLLTPLTLDSETSNRWPDRLVWSELPAALRTAVIAQRPALDAYREGAARASSSLVPPQKYTISISLPVVRSARELQRLAYLDALRLMDVGNHREAAEVLHSAVRASRHLGRRGCMLERLVGSACHANVMPGWHQWSRDPNVTADDIETALVRLRADWKLTPPPSDSYKAEYFFIVNESKWPMRLLWDEINDMIDGWTTKKLGFSAYPTLAKVNTRVPGWQIPILWIMGEPERTARAGRLFLSHELKYCDLPFTEQPVQLPNAHRLHQGTELVAGLTATELNQRLDGTFFGTFNLQGPFLQAMRAEAARQTLLETELEWQIRLRRANAITRADAEALLAEFPWPVDPCCKAGKPIQYRVTEDGLVIGSLGRDGIDQRGDPSSTLRDDEVIVIPWPSKN